MLGGADLRRRLRLTLAPNLDVLLELLPALLSVLCLTRLFCVVAALLGHLLPQVLGLMWHFVLGVHSSLPLLAYFLQLNLMFCSVLQPNRQLLPDGRHGWGTRELKSCLCPTCLLLLPVFLWPLPPVP